MLDERTVAERLISYDTSRPDALVAAAGFVKGWLESRNIEVHDHDHNGLPMLVAEVEAGIPAVEFGPVGAGHHGPDEWVSLSSLHRYRRALADFVRRLTIWVQDAPVRETNLRAVEGGLA